MDIQKIGMILPNIIAALYDAIYVLEVNTNTYYILSYTGEKVKVSNLMKEEEFVSNISPIENLVNDIKQQNEFKKIISTNGQEKLVTLVTEDNYKIVLISTITSHSEKTGDKKLLIIADDSPIITKFFKKSVEPDFEVLIAKDGNEAIDLVNTHLDKNLAGVFLDLQMPKKNGFEVLDYFKENDLFSKVPVSIITGEDSASGIERTTSYEIVDMLQKPFSAEAAKAIVAKTVSVASNH